MLATLYYPNTDPIGLASLLPLAVVVCYSLIVCLSKERGFSIVAPLCFAGLAVSNQGSPIETRGFPNADNCIGYYIWSMAACCFAMEVARTGSKAAVIYGGVILFPMGWLLMFEATVRASDLIESTRDIPRHWIASAATAVWCGMFTILVHRAAQPCLRSGRRERSHQSIDNSERRLLKP